MPVRPEDLEQLARGAVIERRPADSGATGELRPPLTEAPFDPGNGEDRHLAPRDLSRFSRDRQGLQQPEVSELVRETHRPEPRQGGPLAPETAPLPSRAERQHGLFDDGRSEETHRAGPEGAHQTGSQGHSERPAEADDIPREPEREAVTVGAPASAAKATEMIANYLSAPSTPAIVRAPAVAEILGLPLDEVTNALAEVSRNSEGSVTPIRNDVYLVKRGK